MANTFLQAEWRKLIMANYAVDPRILAPCLPPQTELDFWQGRCYVSLVGFMFLETRVKGVKIPFHVHFEEVNLRFYVRYQEGGTWKRGTVFIKEIVPKPAIAWVANTLYQEHYETMPTRHAWRTAGESLHVEYGWKKAQWNTLAIETGQTLLPIAVGSEEEFITEHYWGYTQLRGQKTAEYGVEHPRWEVYRTKDYRIEVDFEDIYGPAFAFLQRAEPQSVFLAEGSPIIVRSGRTL